MKRQLTKYFFSLCAIFFIALATLRASAPDDQLLLREITDNSSTNFYPNLMLRFEMGDTTLTLAEYRRLYYGYAFEEQYKPLATNPEMDKFLMRVAAIDIDAPDEINLREAILAGEKALRHDPFSPKIWNLMAYAFSALGEEDKAKAAADRFEKILLTIKSSGSGVKEKEAQHILMFEHAIDLLAAENLNHHKPMVVSRTVEYIGFVAPQKVGNEKIKGLYFDFSRVYRNKPDSVSYKRDRTWQFNNLAPREYK